MNRLLNYLVPVVLVALTTSCFEKEVFPDTPNIQFQDIVFYDGFTTDSLILSFSFEDGNGNIGIIQEQDILPPFNEFNVYLDSRDSVITADNIGEAVPPVYKAPLITENFIPRSIIDSKLLLNFTEADFPILAFSKVLFSENLSDVPLACPDLANQNGTFLQGTTLTPYVLADNTNIIPTTSGSQVISAAIPVERVETHFNFVIVFEKRVGDDYVPLDYQQIFQTNICDIGNFNGRIPWYDPEGESGTITYAIQSRVLRLAFLDDVIRARFFVYDRAGNKSNEVTTPDFVLADITVAQ